LAAVTPPAASAVDEADWQPVKGVDTDVGNEALDESVVGLGGKVCILLL